MKKLTGQDVQNMVGHWLNTPVNGYLGSDYGQDFKRILQRPPSAGDADAQIAKLQSDVPVIGVLPKGSTNLYAVHSGVDRTDVVLEVSGATFTL